MTGLIGKDKPIVTITAAKEYLTAGTKADLKGFMKEIGATIATKGRSNAQVAGWTKIAASMKRELGFAAGMILSRSMNNNARGITGDKKFFRLMQQMGWQVQIIT